MMDLPPPAPDPAKDPGGANGQVEGVRPVLEPPALAADRVEDLIRFVQGVVVELDPQPRRAAKDPLVHRADLVPAALDPPSGLSIAASLDCSQFSAMSVRSREFRAQ